MEQQITENLPAPHIGVTALADPFSVQRRLSEVPQGWTVAQILDHVGVPRCAWDQTLVLFDGDRILQEVWKTVRPRAGVRVIVKVVPGGGGNNFLRTLLLIAVVVVAFYVVGPYAAAYVGTMPGGFAYAGAASFIAQAGFIAAGTLAINALIPIDQPKFENGTSVSPSLSVGASRNQLKPFSTMPLILGKHRYFPPYAAKPFTEIVGKDQYIRLLFVVGYTNLQITELKLGDTDLSTFEDVEYQIYCGGSTDKDQDGTAVTAITLFTESIDEAAVAQKLDGPGSPVEQTTAVNADEFSLDLTYPNGLIRIDASGDQHSITVTVTVEYKLATASSYALVDTLISSASSADTIREGVRFKFPSRDQYTVRVTRTTDDIDTNGTDQTYQDDVWLTTFRSITNEDPVTHPDAALIALRIRATDQLNGIVSNFNCVASSLLPDYDSTSDTWIEQETNNPASLFRAVLEGKGNARPILSTSVVTWLDGTPVSRLDGTPVLRDSISNSSLDFDILETWHGECETAGRSFNMVLDFASTVWETLKNVAAAGRGRPRHINGLWSVVRDLPQSTPRQHFTPRNSWGFAGAKSYFNMPHAFRVRLINEDEGWQNDEVLVYDDGFTAANATRFETLELTGCTNTDQAWKEARYHIAVARLRPEIFTFSADIESLAVTQGDLIRFMHDAILVGLGAARIKTVNDNGTHATSIDLDDSVPMGTASYSVRVRSSVDGTSSVHAVDTVTGEQSTLTFTTPILLASAPAAGDLIMFGETGLESMELVVDSIIPGTDMSAMLKCYAAAPGVHTADVGDIPPFNSYITQPPGAVVPIIENAVSDESVLVRGVDGTLQVRLLVSFGFLNNRSGVQYIELQFKVHNAIHWTNSPLLQGDAVSASLFDVRESITYKIRARYRFIDTTVGEWSTELTHLVIGKTSPPPDVTRFFVVRQSDGTREFSWVLDNPPPDIAGFRIKWRSGTSGAIWATNMTEMLDAGSLVMTSPWETNQLTAGYYQLAIKAVDLSGNESLNANFINSSLGDPRIKNALIQTNDLRSGWAGTKTNCHVETETGFLVPEGTDTWETIPSTWAAWNGWNENPVPEMSYATEVIDVGASILYDPLVSVVYTSGTHLTEERHGEVNPPDGTWSSYAVTGAAVTARYIQIKVTLTTPSASGLEAMTVILSADTIEEEIMDLDTSTISSPAGDLRLPVVSTFGLITTVQIALQNVGAGWSWEIIDKNPLTGPRIKIYNASNTLADATIDAVIKGL